MKKIIIFLLSVSCFTSCTNNKAPNNQMIFYLPDMYDTTKLATDMEIIERLGGEKVTYISKEKAKEQYLSDGNENWDKVLDANPLPRSIHVELQNSIKSPEQLERFENKVKEQLRWVSSVQRIDFP